MILLSRPTQASERLAGIAMGFWSLTLGVVALYFAVGPNPSTSAAPARRIEPSGELRAETMRPLDPPDPCFERPYLTRFTTSPPPTPIVENEPQERGLRTAAR